MAENGFPRTEEDLQELSYPVPKKDTCKEDYRQQVIFSHRVPPGKG